MLTSCKFVGPRCGYEMGKFFRLRSTRQRVEGLVSGQVRVQAEQSLEDQEVSNQKFKHTLTESTFSFLTGTDEWKQVRSANIHSQHSYPEHAFVSLSIITINLKARTMISSKGQFQSEVSCGF